VREGARLSANGGVTGMSMTADAKAALSKTIRRLRARLIDDLHRATDATYRLGLNPRDARLDQRTLQRRARLTQWIDEQHRAQPIRKGTPTRSKDGFLREAELQAAYTLTNRLIVLKLMEAPGPDGRPLRAPALVTGGWQSRAYRDFRQLAPDLTTADDTEGYAHLLQLTFEDLASELPGIFGPAGVADLISIPAATLRHAVEAINDDTLGSCWSDDLTLGWVYQYWNDPAREELDAKLNSGGKLEPFEVASKTQLFTERYMVDWLLQNSLNPMWLAICRKHNWTPEVETDGTLQELESRRTEWRVKRERNEVELTALMPLHSDSERRWAFYLPQELPDEAVAKAPDSVRNLKILDPAAGSGHFLVVALDLLTAFYREEAKCRGEQGDERWSDRAIIERILSHNLHGIDIDPRAIQIAAATLWLKAREIAPDVSPERLNLVAPNLRLASLPDNDPALTELRTEIERQAGVPSRLTDTIIHALRGADHLGSLLKIDTAVEDALDQVEWVDTHAATTQSDMFDTVRPTQPRLLTERAITRQTVLDRIDAFLHKRSTSDDLGLRLRGEQLAAGVRFARMIREGTYDLVVANPPYQGTARMADASYVRQHYPLGKADLYATFLLRGLELAREGGVSAMLTMRNWMFIKQYAGLREHLLATHGLRALGDFDRGAFEDVPDEVVSVAASAFARAASTDQSVALCPTPRQDTSRDAERTHRKRAATVCHEGRHTFAPAAVKVVPEWPLVYWWNAEMLQAYQSAPLIGEVAPAAKGICTGDDIRLTARPWEQRRVDVEYWPPLIQGGKGRTWLEPLNDTLRWGPGGLVFGVMEEAGRGTRFQGRPFYFRRGVAFSTIGANFSARVHRYPSIFGSAGSSVFPADLAGAVCTMNSTLAREVLASLNPTVNFTVGDVSRLPLFPIEGAEAIFALVEAAFSAHEAHREPSVEFSQPGPTPWRHAQEWAQTAVDRPDGTPLPEYVEESDPEPPTDHLSFALGVALGRFGPAGSDHEGILDPANTDHSEVISRTLPHGILFLDTTLGSADHRDGLGNPAAAPLHAAWAAHGPGIGPRRSLREWLALDFFKDVHRSMYENRPIHWPLSSSGRTFVAWFNIHRINEQTLRVLLADHLKPTLARLEGQLADLRTARDSHDRAAARAAERQYERLSRARGELRDFIADVEQCAERGAPPTDTKCPEREQDARYAPDLDDGVMINSAALWPLLDPQWRDPKKWWKELANAKGRKDYDWSHLAMRYWPTRVDEKCQGDPSLAVAHGCFWHYHPQRAWAWELRLQDEIGPEFRVEEPPYTPGGRDIGDAGDAPHRERYLTEQPLEALASVEREAIRRMGRGAKRRALSEMHLLEPSLWSSAPEAVWELELRLSERQGVEFRLRAPDEPAARAAFESEYPDRVRARAALIAELTPPSTLFEESDEPDDDDEPLDDTNDAEDEDAS
jgi:hypothetical protein